jgi:zinc finger SWIM domain-containing protein 3
VLPAYCREYTQEVRKAIHGSLLADCIGYDSFAFACFPRPRFGHDTSNIVESINSVWREIRELPPLQLLNGIYHRSLTAWYERHHVQLVPGNSILSNTAYKGYKRQELAARSFRVQSSSDTTFLVTTAKGSQYIVSLPPVNPDRLQGSCSCRKYEDYLLPCCHAIACILYLSRDPFLYFSRYYDWDTSLSTYDRPIQPVTIQGLQVLATRDPIRPPFKRVKRGRPRIARIRTNQEETRLYICSVCRQSGHNRRVCPNQPVEHGRAQRARDRLVEGEYSLIFEYKADNNRQ